MGRSPGESSVFVGEGAETFYDTQQYQYGVREKWGYCSYDPNTDSGHHIYPQIPDGGLFIKPWEYGGHPHDFLKATRQARSNDPYVHYEHGKALQKHEKLVSEVEAWRRRELLKEQMLIQLSKLQAVEKQRRHFQELRRHIQLEQLKWSRPMTAVSGATSTPQASREGSLNGGEPHQPHRPGSVNLSTQANSLRGFRRGSRSAGGNHTAPSSARTFKGGKVVPPYAFSTPLQLQQRRSFEIWTISTRGLKLYLSPLQHQVPARSTSDHTRSLTFCHPSGFCSRLLPTDCTSINHNRSLIQEQEGYHNL